MKKLLTGKIRTILILACVLAVLTAIIAAVTPGTTFGRNVTQTLLAPLRGGFATLTRTAERYYDYVFRYERLEADNEYLRNRITAMEDEVRSADSLQRENERLRALLNLSEEHEDYSFTSAYIVAWDSSDWRSAFTIGKGTKSGLSAGMVVVTEYGQVVGLITEVGTSWATVTTVLDSGLEISASIASSGYNGVVRGAYSTGMDGYLRMDYLPTDSVLRNNEQVVTTGSTLYPKDLVLGYVADADFDETGVAKYAVLTPAADFAKLEQVFVITDYVNE